MAPDLDGTLAAPLQLKFCSSGITVGSSEGNNRSGRTDCSNSPPLFPHNMATALASDSSSDNFITGESALSEFIMEMSYLIVCSHASFRARNVCKIYF
jgi:hypothetical protein